MRDALKKYGPCIGMWLLFEAVAVGLWLGLNNVFYLLNFTYIGTCLVVGLALYAAGWRHARRFVQIAVGLYLLGYLGLVRQENLQIEGFWYYLVLGVFEGAVIHYLVAKIAGPFVFGRGWCGYACWTAMVLDVLPWKTSPGRKQGLAWLRWALLIGSVVFVAATFALGIADHATYFVAFIVGNVAYYAVGIVLAFALKDNRAFCKYLCPIGILMKPGAYLSLMRITWDEGRCVDCGACKRACPMDVNMTCNARNRENGTECILCLECVNACPKDALKL